MKTLDELKKEVAKELGYCINKDVSELIYRLCDEVAKRYARQCCEDLRERIIKEAFDDPYDIRRHASSIRNIEIITP